MKFSGVFPRFDSGGPAFLALVAGLVALLVPAASQLAAAEVALNGHVPGAVARMKPTGEWAGTNRMRLALGLPIRHAGELTRLLADLYRPGSANYHHFLTAGQFAERFGPTPAEYQAVQDFALARGLAVCGTHANRRVLDVTGTAGQVAAALQIHLQVYPHPAGNRRFHAPDREPTVPAGLPLLHVSGLDDWQLPRPMNLHARPANVSGGLGTLTGSAPGGSFAGYDFRKAYVPGSVMTGLGQQVGLLELSSGYFPADITAYEQLTGLPMVPVSAVLVDNYNGGPGMGNAECSLDIEMALAMAPGLMGILVYEGVLPNDVLNQMAEDDAAQQLSSSWTFPTDATTDQTFQQMAAQGQTFFNASGDGNAWVNGVDSPCDDPYLTSVGGTTLSTTKAGAWASETVWRWNATNGSGGGISVNYPLPNWQQGVDMTLNQGSYSQRNLPDVALTADNIYVLYGDGATGVFGGTSCAAPPWAGLTALVNQQAAVNGGAPVGFLNPLIYQLGQAVNYTNVFHDITTGSNTSLASPNFYYAVPGYDLCTGWGTPAGQSLLDALVGPAQPTPASILTQPQSQVVTVGATVTFSVVPGGLPPFRYQWTFNGTNLAGATNSWLTISPADFGQAGQYQVQVSNAYGSAAGGPAQLTVTQPPPCDPAPAGLVSWWRGEGNALDAYSLNNGIMEGGIEFTNGEAGLSFYYNSSAADVRIPASPSLDVGLGKGFTLEAWVNCASVSQLNPVFEWNKGDGTTPEGAHFYVWSDGSLYANLVDTGGITLPGHAFRTAPGLIQAGSFYHIALTYDINTGLAQMYCNGAIASENLLGFFTPLTSYDLYLGRRPLTVGETYSFIGCIDEPSIYSRVLSASEIAAIYHAGGGGKCFAPPMITGQPTNVTTRTGGTATFSVTAAGLSPLSYQWFFDGSSKNLPWATNAVLTLTNVQGVNAGQYAVQVTNVAGSALSEGASLGVAGQLHFVWSAVPSPRFVNGPFMASLNAETTANVTASNFNGTVSLTTTNGLLVLPAVAGPFNQGWWTGSLQFPAPGANVVLQANDTLGDTGQANPVNIFPPPSLGTAAANGVLLAYWPQTYPGFFLETAARLNTTNWQTLQLAPGIFLGQYFVALPLTNKSAFYRLRFGGP